MYPILDCWNKSVALCLSFVLVFRIYLDIRHLSITIHPCARRPLEACPKRCFCFVARSRMYRCEPSKLNLAGKTLAASEAGARLPTWNDIVY